LVAPVVLVGFDVVVAEDLAAGRVGHGDGGFVGEDDGGLACVLLADAEVG